MRKFLIILITFITIGIITNTTGCIIDTSKNEKHPPMQWNH